MLKTGKHRQVNRVSVEKVVDPMSQDVKEENQMSLAAKEEEINRVEKVIGPMSRVGRNADPKARVLQIRHRWIQHNAHKSHAHRAKIVSQGSRAHQGRIVHLV